jgi:hypothetical protein
VVFLSNLYQLPLPAPPRIILPVSIEIIRQIRDRSRLQTPSSPQKADARIREGGGAQGRVIVGYLANILSKVDIPADIEGTILMVCTTLVALVYPANLRA